MHLILKRINTGVDGTFGKLYDEDANQLCVTCELPEYAGDSSIANEPNTDCIPAGTYKCSIVNSPSKGRVYHVKDVPGRTHILIHSGNTIADSAGCILLGLEFGHLNGKAAVLKSTAAMKELYKYTQSKSFILTIERHYAS